MANFSPKSIQNHVETSNGCVSFSYALVNIVNIKCRVFNILLLWGSDMSDASAALYIAINGG